jgi:hypothetical protein
LLSLKYPLSASRSPTLPNASGSSAILPSIGSSGC